MPSPTRNERRDFRYPLHLPVVIRMAQHNAMRTHSENISLGGLLLSSPVPIPEGSTIELSVGVEHLPDSGVLLRARGKVLRLLLKDTGDFAVAIQLQRAFKLPVAEPLPSNLHGKKPAFPESRPGAALGGVGAGLVPAWHTET